MNHSARLMLLLATPFAGLLGCGSNAADTPVAMAGAASGGAPAGAGTGGAAAGSPSGGKAGDTDVAGSGGSAAGAGGSPQGGAGAGTGGDGAGGVATVELVVKPGELVFGSVQKVAAASQKLELSNPGTAPIAITKLSLDAVAAGTPTFELVKGPTAGEMLAAGAKVEVEIGFEPSGIGFFESKLLIEAGSPSKTTPIGLYGLGTKGLEGENEPFLEVVLKTLGYAVDVGGAGLLSTTTPLVGSEVAALRFKAAAAGEVGITPVARYSPEEPIPYGFYQGQTETVVGTIANDDYQALNPRTDAGSKASFTAPSAEFGLFTTSKTHQTYTEDAKNAANATKHAVRTYPLKDRAGKAVLHGYLVCFEEAANGDYQDYVFTLTNVVPVAP